MLCPALLPDNPCAYLAALGLLRLTTELDADATMSWSNAGCGCAVLQTSWSMEDLAIELARRNSDPLPVTDKNIRSLPAAEWQYDTWLGRSDHVAGSASTVTCTQFIMTPRKGNGGGWLVEARKAKKYMHDPAKWMEAMTCWHHVDQATPLALDPSCRQDSALQANAATDTGQITTAGAVWLAIHGLTMFPLYPSARRNPLTAGWWDGESFEYLTWDRPLPLNIVRRVCRAPFGQVPAMCKWQKWRAATIGASNDSKQLLMAALC